VINKLKCDDCAGISFVCTLKGGKMQEGSGKFQN